MDGDARRLFLERRDHHASAGRRGGHAHRSRRLTARRNGDARRWRHRQHDAGAPPDEGAVDAAGCFVLSPAQFVVDGFSPQRVALRASLGGGTSLTVEIFGAATKAAYPLGTAPDDAFAAPEHARVAARYGTGAGDFLATAGSVTLTSIASPLSVEVAGELAGLRLEEVEVADGGWAKKPGGACLSLASAVFDTRAAVGTACTSARQCGTKVCDPLTLTCQPPPCTVEGPAPGGLVCKKQSGAWQGQMALYRACTLEAASSGCADDEECVGVPGAITSPLPATCMKRGTHALDAACTGTGPGDSGDVSTGCTAGLLCRKFVGLDYVCGKRCDFFGPSGQCPASERCQSQLANAVCAPKPPVSAAVGIGAACATNMVAFCADDGAALRGFCDADSFAQNAPRTCRRICRTNADCAGAQTCTPSLEGGLRVCK